MLPASFSETGDYPEAELDRARGYRLLAHAEIEAFIEDITLAAAKAGVAAWSKSRKASDLLVCLMAHYHSGFDDLEDPGVPIYGGSSRRKVKEAIKEVVDVALLQYIKIHEQNHGIRDVNLRRLILPIGVRSEDLDPTWMTNLSEFSKRRGDVAHKTAKAHQQIDPQAEFQDVHNLVPGLEELDRLVLQVSS